MILCECGVFIEGNTFRDYIKNSANPSTPTIGHCKCGLIFDFIDGKKQKKYSSRKELKSLAMRFAERHMLENNEIGRFLVNVDRFKSLGKFTDSEIITIAFENNYRSLKVETHGEEGV
jgi:hypothetical protein